MVGSNEIPPKSTIKEIPQTNKAGTGLRERLGLSTDLKINPGSSRLKAVAENPGKSPVEGLPFHTYSAIKSLQDKVFALDMAGRQGGKVTSESIVANRELERLILEAIRKYGVTRQAIIDQINPLTRPLPGRKE